MLATVGLVVAGGHFSDLSRGPRRIGHGRLGQTEFGQSDFGQRKCFSGMADLGQNRLRLVFVCVCVCVCVVWMLVSRFPCGGFKVLVSHVQCPRDRPSRDRDRPPPDSPPPGPPKISLFFSLSRRKIRSFLPSLGVFSLNFDGVFEDRDPKM